MKKTLTSIFLLAIFTISSKIYAQCDLQFNNLVIQLVSTNDTLGTKCRITFNASFDINTNSGFKYLFFHSWLNADYPNPAIFDCSGSTPAVNPGTATQLGTSIDEVGKSFLDIGFIGLKDITDTLSTTNLVDVTSKFATSFPHDGSVVLIKPANAPGLTALMSKTGSILHFEVTNIKVIINAACGGPVSVFTDIWGSNSNAGDPKAQCYICKIPQFFNNPIISGFKICNLPRTYAISITTIDPVLDDIRYKVYIDLDNDGILDVGEPLAFTSGLINISSTQSYTPGGSFTLPFPYSHTNPYVAKGYIIQVDFEPPTTKNSVRKAFPNPPGCILLPVSLKSFTATRSNRANVSVKWETVSENNSAGFTVERKIKTDWEQVAYLPSLAFGGNSNSLLTYQINDVNDSKGISQYRIRQIDLDGVSKLSDIRSVRGEGQRGNTIVYPNPSNDGKVNVLFEGGEITKRDISVQDMNGRIIKQWKNYTNNNIQIENLTPGFYTVRVLDVGTGEQIVEKLVVNKR
jgi:hypothetical protein